MRIVGLSVSNVGGLADFDLNLPAVAVSAIAGANGTGKSKFLACLLSPWSRQIPTPRTGQIARVNVRLKLSAAERHSIAEYSNANQWGNAEPPEFIDSTVSQGEMIGQNWSINPPTPALQNIFGNPYFMQFVPGLDVVYLPAERRLLAPNAQGIDLSQLSDAIAFQKNAESRAAVNNYGRLDDQEFEQFAKALCVAAALPPEPGTEEGDGHEWTRWSEFLATVNSLISPKELLPLSQQHPDQLRIRTPSGDVHAVQDLSSGERQALIIMSRVIRAGASNAVILIDEPDAYLHPHLSRRLILALESGLSDAGQLIVATHSPSILDGIPPAGILRLEYASPPALILDESERLELYRQAGFKASALTQSDLLIVTEGESDGALLSLAFPDLASAAIHSAGGKARVLREVEQLDQYDDLPVLGIVDKDVETDDLGAVAESVHVWSAADIEGVFLSDEIALQLMIDNGLIIASYPTVTSLVSLLRELCDELHENVVAEIAQRELRQAANVQWPTPKGEHALQRLRDSVRAMSIIEPEAVESAIEAAEKVWESSAGARFGLVRGKYVLKKFVTTASNMTTGTALLEAVARKQPQLAGFAGLRAKLAVVRGAAAS